MNNLSNNNAVYLNYVNVNRFSQFTIKYPRSRFIEYYKDLYHLENNVIDDCTFILGDQATYIELGKLVLDECVVSNQLNDVDTLICAMWSHEFDPDYSSSGPYFSNRYQIKDVFDVGDQGSISTFLSVKILMQYILNPHAKKVALLGLEQTTIPRNLIDNPVLPTFSGAGVLICSNYNNLSNRDEKNNIRIIYAEVINEAEIMNYKFNLFKIILNICQLLNINSEQLSVSFKRNSNLWRSYRYFENEKKISLHSTMGYFLNDFGLLPFLNYLYYLFKNKNNLNSESRYIAILDEDVESFNVGIIILEIV